MTYSISIGRCALDYAESLSDDGGSISGTFDADDLAEADVKRQNVLNLAGTIVPVVWPAFPTFDGFYRVTGSSAQWSRGAGLWEWSVDLEPLPHHRALEVEATCRGAARTNAPSNEHEPWYAIPSGALAVNHATGSIATDTRTGPGGSVLVMTGAGFYDRYARWTVSAGHYLDMAATVSFDGTTVVGQQSTLSPLTVVLSNGLFKLSMATGSNTFQITAPAATSSNWGTAAGLDLGWWDGISALTVMDPDAFYAARITRNDPQVCSVRWSYYAAGLIVHVDASLRRGSCFAEIVLSQESAYTGQKFGILQAACQTVVKTDRVLRSSAVEDNYRIIFHDTEGTSSTGDGLIYSTAAVDQLRVGVGTVLEGASATSENTHGVLKEQFYAFQLITERFSGVRQ